MSDWAAANLLNTLSASTTGNYPFRISTRPRAIARLFTLILMWLPAATVFFIVATLFGDRI